MLIICLYQTNFKLNIKTVGENKYIQSLPLQDRFHQTFREAETLKTQKDNPRIPDIFSLKLNFIHREECTLLLFHVLINKLLELNEVLIHLFVAVSLRINAILTQLYLRFNFSKSHKEKRKAAM